MFLIGYHGTALDKANNIIKTGKYNISTGEKEWLGHGIYFYPKYRDAYTWKDSEIVLRSIILVKRKEYIDIESSSGKDLFRMAIEKLETMGYSLQAGHYQENQCAICKMLWNQCPQIKVMKGRFATEKSKYDTLTDIREKRAEFCVRDNDCIHFTRIVRRSERNEKQRNKKQ